MHEVSAHGTPFHIHFHYGQVEDRNCVKEMKMTIKFLRLAGVNHCQFQLVSNYILSLSIRKITFCCSSGRDSNCGRKDSGPLYVKLPCTFQPQTQPLVEYLAWLSLEKLIPHAIDVFHVQPFSCKTVRTTIGLTVDYFGIDIMHCRRKVARSHPARVTATQVSVITIGIVAFQAVLTGHMPREHT